MERVDADRIATLRESPQRLALRAVLRPPILYRTIKIALTVGTLLTIVNQAEGIVGAADFSAWKALLTYLVPLIVASYAAWGAVVERFQIAKAAEDARARSEGGPGLG
jgi:hypothetical protein